MPKRPSSGARPPYRLRLAPTLLLVPLLAVMLAGCGSGSATGKAASPRSSPSTQLSTHAVRLTQRPPRARYAVPPLLDAHNVYAAAAAGELSPTVRRDRPLVYVPDSGGSAVQEIDPATRRVVRQFPVGSVPQHIVPSYDLKTLWVTNDMSNSLTPINPRTGLPGRAVPVADPYNMYFTPDGRYAIVMAERLRRMDFRDSHTMRLRHSLSVPGCAGVNHADFTANGRIMLVSCEFGAAMIVVNVPSQRVVRTLSLPGGSAPQDVKLSPDGRVFYVADLRGGVWEFDARTFRRLGFIRTGPGAHGLYPSRDARFLYVSNRNAGTISLISFRTRRVAHTWQIPGGGSPDMGGVSASGAVLWLSGRYSSEVYALSTRTGKLLARIPVGPGPHGVCVWPQPGRYSLGHTGVMR